MQINVVVVVWMGVAGGGWCGMGGMGGDGDEETPGHEVDHLNYIKLVNCVLSDLSSG